MLTKLLDVHKQSVSLEKKSLKSIEHMFLTPKQSIFQETMENHTQSQTWKTLLISDTLQKALSSVNLQVFLNICLVYLFPYRNGEKNQATTC